MNHSPIALIGKSPIVTYGLRTLLCNQPDNPKIVELDSFPNETLLHTAKLAIVIVQKQIATELLNHIKTLPDRMMTNDIIIYDLDPTPARIIEFLRSGAKGYLSASEPVDELLKCVDLVSKGKSYVSPDIFQHILIENTSKIKAAKNAKELSEREQEIADKLVVGMRVTQIAKMLGLKPSTISTTKGNILKKLSVENVLELKDKLQKKRTRS